MDDNTTQLDNELADLTDALRSGMDHSPGTDLRDLDTVVHGLNRLIAPGDGPDPAFRARLTQRLAQEWDAAHPHQPNRIPVFNRRVMLYVALAASLGVVVGLVLLLSKSGPLTGTAVAGDNPLIIVIIVAAGLAIAGVVLWRRGR